MLTGSANLLMMERIGETLAGRACMSACGLSRAASVWASDAPVHGASCSRPRSGAGARSSPRTRARRRTGGRPPDLEGCRSRPTTSTTTRIARIWFSGYVQTYLERDLQTLRAVENLADFRRLMRAACLRIGDLVNQTELGRDVGMAQPQVHRFLNLMEASYQAVRLPALP